MDIRKITDNYFVTPQIEVIDILEVARLGFVAVMNNRPDNEVPGQPGTDAFTRALEKTILGYHHIPIAGSNFSDQDITEFKQALAMANGPVLAFCRSGTRSTKLWALAEVDVKSVDEVITTAAKGGYDLNDMRPQLEARASRHT